MPQGSSDGTHWVCTGALELLEREGKAWWCLCQDRIYNSNKPAQETVMTQQGPSMTKTEQRNFWIDHLTGLWTWLLEVGHNALNWGNILIS
jgi:hypothetical protein